MFAAIQGRLSEAELLAPEHPVAARQWSELVHEAVLRDEAAMWGMRFKRLERLRLRLEELREVAAVALPDEPPAHAGATQPARPARRSARCSRWRASATATAAASTRGGCCAG